MLQPGLGVNANASGGGTRKRLQSALMLFLAAGLTAGAYAAQKKSSPAAPTSSGVKATRTDNSEPTAAAKTATSAPTAADPTPISASPAVAGTTKTAVPDAPTGEIAGDRKSVV